jgi:hypothetical protein
MTNQPRRLRSSGTLVYDPTTRAFPTCNQWWLVLECCPDLARYYRAMYDRYFRGHSVLRQAPWGSHISIIRGEEPLLGRANWGFRHGTEIEFEFSDQLLTDGDYCWLPVFCEPLLDLREQFGLPRQPSYPLHLTIGRIALQMRPR